MAAIEFIAPAGKTFTAQLYNAISGATIGAPITGITNAVPTRYRFNTAATGIVFINATATNLQVGGYVNLDQPAASGYSELLDTYEEAQALNLPTPPAPDPGDPVSAETIAAAAMDPQSISVDGLTVTQRPMSDQIAADRHAAANKGDSASKGFGLRFARFQPGSAVGE